MKRNTAPAGSFITITEAAEYLGINHQTVRVMISDGRLRAYSLGPRIVRIKKSELDAALQPYGGAA